MLDMRERKGMRAERLGPELPARPAPVHTTPTPTSEEDIDVAALPGWSPSTVLSEEGLSLMRTHTFTPPGTKATG